MGQPDRVQHGGTSDAVRGACQRRRRSPGRGRVRGAARHRHGARSRGNDSPPQVVVYDAPPSTSFVQMFQAMIADGDTVISTRGRSARTRPRSPRRRRSTPCWRARRRTGISVFNGAGDTGSTCLDGSPDTVGVPADSPQRDRGRRHHAHARPGSDGSPNVVERGGLNAAERAGRLRRQQVLLTPRVPDRFHHRGGSIGARCRRRRGSQRRHRDLPGRRRGLPGRPRLGRDEHGGPRDRDRDRRSSTKRSASNIGDFNAAAIPARRSSQRVYDAGADGHRLCPRGARLDPNYQQMYEQLGGLTPGAVSASASRVGHSSAAPADGATQGVVRVQLFDANGLPLPGKTVKVSAAERQRAVHQRHGRDRRRRRRCFTATDTVAESTAVTAVDSTDNVPLTSQPTLTFVSPTATGASDRRQPVDRRRRRKLSDDDHRLPGEQRCGRPAAGKTVSLSAGGASATISPSSDQAITGSDGDRDVHGDRHHERDGRRSRRPT